MWKSLPLPPSVDAMLVPGAGVSRQQLLYAGATDTHIARLLRRGRLRQIGRGRYYVPTAATRSKEPAPTLLDEGAHLTELAAVQQKFPDVVISHRSAALVHNLPLWCPPTVPELIRHPGCGRPDGLRLLRACAIDVEVERIDGLWVTTTERTASDLALRYPTPAALVTIDAVLHRGVPASTINEALRARGPVRGVRRARVTLGLADRRSESALESYSRGVLLGNGVPRPLVNPWIRLDCGWVRPDALWPDLGIVGEADGALKYADTRPEALWAEKVRQEAIERAGLFVLRWTYDEIVNHSRHVVARFLRLAQRRDGDPWRPSAYFQVRLDRPTDWRLP